MDHVVNSLHRIYCECFRPTPIASALAHWTTVLKSTIAPCLREGGRAGGREGREGRREGRREGGEGGVLLWKNRTSFDAAKF